MPVKDSDSANYLPLSDYVLFWEGKPYEVGEGSNTIGKSL